MEKSYPNKIAWCPVCNQGWVEIVKAKETGHMFVCCSECEVEWEHPDEVSQQDKGTRFKHGEVVQPSAAQIKEFGWGIYVNGTQ